MRENEKSSEPASRHFPTGLLKHYDQDAYFYDASVMAWQRTPETPTLGAYRFALVNAEGVLERTALFSVRKFGPACSIYAGLFMLNKAVQPLTTGIVRLPIGKRMNIRLSHFPTFFLIVGTGGWASVGQLNRKKAFFSNNAAWARIRERTELVIGLPESAAASMDLFEERKGVLTAALVSPGARALGLGLPGEVERLYAWRARTGFWKS